jgi:hypothetical protein
MKEMWRRFARQPRSRTHVCASHGCSSGRLYGESERNDTHTHTHTHTPSCRRPKRHAAISGRRHSQRIRRQMTHSSAACPPGCNAGQCRRHLDQRSRRDRYLATQKDVATVRLVAAAQRAARSTCARLFGFRNRNKRNRFRFRFRLRRRFRFRSRFRSRFLFRFHSRFRSRFLFRFRSRVRI